MSRDVGLSSEEVELRRKLGRLARRIIATAEESPLQFVGKGHYILASTIRPNLKYDFVKALRLDRATSSFLEAQMLATRTCLRVIDEELVRLDRKVARRKGKAGRAARYHRSLTNYVAWVLVSTRARLLGVADLLKEPLTPGAEFVVKSADDVIVPEARKLYESKLGLSPRGIQIVPPLTEEANVCSGQSQSPQLAFGPSIEWFESSQDHSLLHIREVSNRLHRLTDLERRVEPFTRDDLEVVQWIFRERVALWQRGQNTESDEVIRSTQSLVAGIDTILDNTSRNPGQIVANLISDQASGVRLESVAV